MNKKSQFVLIERGVAYAHGVLEYCLEEEEFCWPEHAGYEKDGEGGLMRCYICRATKRDGEWTLERKVAER